MNTFRFLTCCLLGLLCLADGLAEPPEIDEQRICVVPFAGESSDEIHRLLVERIGFAPTSGSNQSKVQLLRSLMLCRHAVVYLEGSLDADDQGLRLKLTEDFQLNLPEFIGELEKLAGGLEQVDLLIDVETDLSGDDIRSRLEPQFASSGISVRCILAGQREIGKHGPLASAMIAGLRVTPAAGAVERSQEGPSAIGMADLFRSVKRNASDKTLLLPFRSTVPAERAKLFDRPGFNLDQVIEDVAWGVSQICQDQQVDQLVVMPWMVRGDRGVRPSGMGRVTAGRLRQLLDYRYSAPVVSESEALRLVDTTEVKWDELWKQRRSLDKVVETQQRTAILIGGIAGYEYSEVDRQFTSLRDLELCLVIAQRDAETDPPDTWEWKLDQVPIEQSQSAMVQSADRMAMSMIDGLTDFTFETHPMKDESFRPRISLLVGEGQDERILEHSFYEPNDSRMRVALPFAQFPELKKTYRIRVDNTGGEAFFLRLLVDGKNVLPQSLERSGDPIPMPIVDLIRARAFYIAANKRCTFEGFFQSIDDADAKIFQFKVTDDLDRKHFENLDTGIITAGIYPAVEKQFSSMALDPQYATVPGELRQVDISPYTSEYAPADEPRAVVTLDYGF